MFVVETVADVLAEVLAVRFRVHQSGVDSRRHIEIPVDLATVEAVRVPLRRSGRFRAEGEQEQDHTDLGELLCKACIRDESGRERTNCNTSDQISDKWRKRVR